MLVFAAIDVDPAKRANSREMIAAVAGALAEGEDGIEQTRAIATDLMGEQICYVGAAHFGPPDSERPGCSTGDLR